ncbi:unnamed protein product [Closterium sp. Naga37s-1]|nr:unnamed protein product [Closterium sp. Naga37s-1]
MLKLADLTAVRGTCSSLYRLAVRARPSVSIRVPPKLLPDFSSFHPSSHFASLTLFIHPHPSPLPFPVRARPSVSIRQPPKRLPASPLDLPSTPISLCFPLPPPPSPVRARPSVSIRQPPKRLADFPSFLARAGPSLSALTILPTAQLPATCLTLIGQHCPGLVTLNLTDQKGVTDTVLAGVGGGCVGLKTLKVKVHHGKLSQGLEAIAANCRMLETLSLPTQVKVRHGKLSKGLEAIAANCRMIEMLSLPTQVRESSLGPLLSSFPHLTRLDLSWSTKLADPAFATIASSCSRLTHLDASFSQISHVGLASLAAHCPALSSLHLNACHAVRPPLCLAISHTGLASLAAHCPALSSLRLNACHAVRPPLCLPVLARLPSLQSLDLGQSPLLPDWIEGIISLQAGVQDRVCGGKERSGGKDRCGGKEGPGAAAGTTPLAGFPCSASAPAVASTACTPAAATAAAAAAAAAGAASSGHLLPSLRTLTAYFQANQTIRATWIESLALACPTLCRINFGTTSRILLSPTPSTTTTTTTQLTTSSSSSAVNALPGPPTSTPSPSAHRRILTPRSPGIFSRLAALASPRTKPHEGPPRAGGGPSSAGVGCAGGSAAARNGAGSGGASDAAASLVSAAAPAPVAAAAAAPRDTDTASPAPLPATPPPPTAPTALSSATAATASAHTPPRTPNHAPPLESLVLPCFGMSDTVISAIASACPSLTSLRFDPGSKKRYAKILGMFQVAGALDIDCTVTDASLQSLAASCPSLSELHLFSDYLLGTGLSSHSPTAPASTSPLPALPDHNPTSSSPVPNRALLSLTRELPA